MKARGQIVEYIQGFDIHDRQDYVLRLSGALPLRPFGIAHD